MTRLSYLGLALLVAGLPIAYRFGFEDGLEAGFWQCASELDAVSMKDEP